MADGLKDIIASLDKQRVAIERALDALREVDGSMTAAASKPSRVKQGVKSARVQRAAKTAPAARKGRISDEGRRKLADAMKRRWAAKRAGSAATKAPAKRSPAKKKATA